MESQNSAAPKQIPTSKSHHPIEVGRHVSCGFRQSIPDSKYPICAGVIVTIASAGEGHRNRPRCTMSALWRLSAKGRMNLSRQEQRRWRL
jgi:hypothetical protein